MILQTKMLINTIIYCPHIIAYYSSPNRHLINLDVYRWCDELGLTYRNNKALLYLLSFKPQFRNLFFFRLQSHSKFLTMLCPPDPSLTIADDCGFIEGGGVYFEHANATHLSLNYLGRGGVIRQLTTFGVKSKHRHNERPTIGKNVDFGANVTCIGDINIGNNAIIAAGAVVVSNVPENAIVAGNPAKVIKYRNKNTIN